MTLRPLGVLLLLLHGGVAEGQESRASVEPLFGASRDSDANLGFRVGVRVTAPVAERATLGVDAWRWQVEDGVDRVRSFHAAATASVRPASSLLVEGAVGGTFIDLSGSAASETVLPTGRLRFRWRGMGGAMLDLRGRRDVVESSPDLIANLVTRTEASATADIPLVLGLKLRGVGRVGRLTDRLDSNTRLAGAAMLVFAHRSVEVSAQLHATSYDHFSTAGYFAPRLVQGAQLGSYGEFEGERVMFAYDVSGGVQRLAGQGLPLGGWGRALSLWSQLGVGLTTSTQVRLELELYDSPAPAYVFDGPGWRYGAGTLSLRQSL